MIQLEQLSGITAFVQAADAGSFTLAAQRLGLSKSGVAKSVSRLEERLGVRLINRTTRRFALTGEGETFLASCTPILEELSAAAAAMTAHGATAKGRLRIDLPTVFGRRWVLPVLLEIAERSPDLSFEVSLTDRRVDPIEEGIDLVVRIGDLADSSALMTRKLGIQESVLCASPAYLEREGLPASLPDLDAHACIVFGRGGQVLPWWFLDARGAPTAKPVVGRMMFNDSEAIRDAVLAGQGVALLATWLIAEDLGKDRLISLLRDTRTRGFPIHALWPKARQTSPKVRIVVDELVRRFATRAPWD